MTLIIILIVILHQQFTTSQFFCRCLASNSSCWPNVTVWQVFNKSIDGHLIVPKPSAAVCDGSMYDGKACGIAKAQWSNSTWRGDQVGAMQVPNWENSSCSILVNSSTCNQGAVPVLAVDATLPEHVQATVRFAGMYNLRLVIKSSGHDFLGRSTAAGSLLLWLHHMKNMTMLKQYLSCELTNVADAIRVAAGVQWGEVYQFLNQSNLVAIGAASGTVSVVGGYLQGGGHSPLSRWKGMASDQVLEYDVVTANGQIVTANSCQNEDLFWALNGGGGSTFGIVISAVFRTFPSPYIIAATHAATASNKASHKKLIRSFVKVLPKLADAGWSGYFDIVDLELNALFHVPNGDRASVNAILKQFTDKHLDLDFRVINTFTFPSFYNYFSDILERNNPTGFNFLMSSRLIPENIIRSKPNHVAKVFIGSKGHSANRSNLRGSFVAGGQVANAANRNNSVNPAWRKALLHMICTQAWLDTTSKVDESYLTSQVLHRAAMFDTLLPVGLQPASYANEANANEVNWKEKFFGPKKIYDQLKKIKEKYDRYGLFVCTGCVGSDDWTLDLNCPVSSTKQSCNL